MRASARTGWRRIRAARPCRQGLDGSTVGNRPPRCGVKSRFGAAARSLPPPSGGLHLAERFAAGSSARLRAGCDIFDPARDRRAAAFGGEGPQLLRVRALRKLRPEYAWRASATGLKPPACRDAQFRQTGERSAGFAPNEFARQQRGGLKPPACRDAQFWQTGERSADFGPNEFARQHGGSKPPACRDAQFRQTGERSADFGPNEFARQRGGPKPPHAEARISRPHHARSAGFGPKEDRLRTLQARRGALPTAARIKPRPV